MCAMRSGEHPGAASTPSPLRPDDARAPLPFRSSSDLIALSAFRGDATTRSLSRPNQCLRAPGDIGTAPPVGGCQSAFKFDPVSASNFDPFERRVLAVALAPSELAGVAETVRARVA